MVKLNVGIILFIWHEFHYNILILNELSATTIFPFIKYIITQNFMIYLAILYHRMLEKFCISDHGVCLVAFL